MTKFFLYICIIFILANCSNKTTYSGKFLNNEELKEINFTNKEKLISKLGTPSYIDPIENKFFYIRFYIFSYRHISNTLLSQRFIKVRNK